MDAEAILKIVLVGNTDADDRVFPLRVPEKETRPSLVYQRISNSPQYSLRRHSGLDYVRIQITAWAHNYAAAKALAAQVRPLMEGSALKALLVSDADVPDDVSKLFGVAQDFNCWQKSVA